MGEREVVSQYFAAMRRGAEAEAELMALFADDAVYIDPFSGTTRVSEGSDAIREAFRQGWEFPLPDLKLTVDEIVIEPGAATARWTCESPALPAPVTGRDRYTVVDGKITRLEVDLVDSADESLDAGEESSA